MKIIPVIIAGGIGQRFWPFSRSSSPKQLLPIISKKSMIEETFLRVKPLCNRGSKPLVVTGKTIASKIRKVIPAPIKYDCIVEPVGKNTAPAIAIAAAWLKKKYGEDCVMVVLPADHSITPQKAFIDAVRYAVILADSLEKLIVFGIQPSRPDTGYGYIHAAKQIGKSGAVSGYNVKRFIEKPDLKKAIQFVAAKKYFWNSGMFVWKTSVILKEFQNHMPSVYELVAKAETQGLTKKAIDKFYLTCIKESIDYGIMEPSKHVAVVKGQFQWDDIGSWEAVSRVLPQNNKKTTTSGKKVYEKDCQDTIIANNSKLPVAAIGLKDIVVVTVDDAVLVIARDKLPKFKDYLKEIKNTPGFSKRLF
jgi:mannose-1-phosphate guanylyltransferase/mannose-6-phosphate isomerase